jgi:hypothetical protein
MDRSVCISLIELLGIFRVASVGLLGGNEGRQVLLEFGRYVRERPIDRDTVHSRFQSGADVYSLRQRLAVRKTTGLILRRPPQQRIGIVGVWKPFG